MKHNEDESQDPRIHALTTRVTELERRLAQQPAAESRSVDQAQIHSTQPMGLLPKRGQYEGPTRSSDVRRPYAASLSIPTPTLSLSRRVGLSSTCECPTGDVRPEPAHILTTEYVNPVYMPWSPDWTKDLVDGGKWLHGFTPRYQWMQVLDSAGEYDRLLVGAAGWAVRNKIAGLEVPFTHPFGRDYEFYLAPDSQYQTLLVPSNIAGDEEYAEATCCAQRMGLDVPCGVLGVETDKGLLPEDYRANDGDRVAVFGRWIVDAGHDFHTEIHPPLLMVSARSISPQGIGIGPATATLSRVIGRPYLVSQEFLGGGLFEHLVKEAVRVVCPGWPATLPFCSFHLAALARLLPMPFSGFQEISYRVRPPIERPSTDHELFVTFHFTVRSGVSVQIIWSEPDTLTVLITMDDLKYIAPPPPPEEVVNVRIDELGEDVQEIFNDVIVGAALAPLGPAFGVPVTTNPQAALILNQGIFTKQYEAPTAVSRICPAIQRLPAATLRGYTPYSVDDRQPFPIFGFLVAEWQGPAAPTRSTDVE
jgi:hypothetical protein